MSTYDHAEQPRFPQAVGSGKIWAGAQLLNFGRVVEAACLMLDVRMPNMDGLELQRRLRETEEEENRALQSGAVAFLRKPVSKDALLRVIHMALESPD